MSEVAEILEQRNGTHGDFTENATISQTLKRDMRAAPGWYRLRPYEMEALEQIALKLSRILSLGGDAHFVDHWLDLSGYATLAAERNKDFK